jgi:hypothetical protein
MAYLGLTGAMKTASTAAIEGLSGLPELHLKMKDEARAGIYRLYCCDQWKPKSVDFEHAHKAQSMTENQTYIWGLIESYRGMSMTNLSQSDCLTEVNGKTGLNLRGRED